MNKKIYFFSNINKLKKDKILILLLFFLLFSIIFRILLIILNCEIVYSNSNSDKNGIYLINFNQKKLTTNDYTSFCISDSKALSLAYSYHLKKGGNWCSNHSYPLLKHVCAKPNDLITIKNNVFFINGYKSDIKIINNKKLYYKINWQESKEYIVPKDNYFICGKSKLSFDSRYYGFIEESQIVGKAYLLYGY